jgi:hypothetical protein
MDLFLPVLTDGAARAARLLSPIQFLLRSQHLFFAALVWAQMAGKKGNVYNILWALVFGFATLNILALGARRVDPAKRQLSFGEMLAILIVIMSLVLLAWELLYLFKVLPIKLHPR